MKRFSLFLLSAVSAGLMTEQAHAVPSAASDKIERTASVNTGYGTAWKDRAWSNSNTGASILMQEWNQFHGFLFDLADDSKWGGKHPMVLGLVEWVPFLAASFVDGYASFWKYTPSVYFHNATKTTYHEFGHYTRFKANNYLNPEMHVQGQPYEKNLLPFFGQVLTHPEDNQKGNTIGYGFSGTPAAWVVKDVPEPFKADYLQNCKDGTGQAFLAAAVTAGTDGAALVDSRINDQNISFYAAGVNNEMRLSGDLADAAYDGRGHLVDFFPYFGLHRGSDTYPMTSTGQGDMDLLIAGYAKKGILFKKKDFDTANWLGLLLSSSTWSYLKSWGNYFSGQGKTQVDTVEFQGVRAPDVENYLLMEGLSYKIKTGYRVNEDLHIPISVEFLTKGGKGAEISLGAEKNLPSMHDVSVGGKVLFGRALTGEFHVRVPLMQKKAFVEGRVEYAHLKSFEGQRNIANLSTSEKGASFVLRAGFYY